MRKIFPIMAALSISAACAFGAMVKIEGGNGSFRLMRDGKEYFVNGGGGGAPKDILAAIGGNSFRTWGAGNTEQDLQIAAKNGLTVTVGFWLGHAAHGFDYTNKSMTDKQTADVLAVVRKYKDDPSVLIWALGNEMEMGNPHEVEMWQYINDLAKQVKAIDPNHPVMTVIAEIPDAKVQNLHRYCPDIDVVGINTYAGVGSIPERWRKAGGTKPYIITEYGPPLNSEWWKHSKFGCPYEMTSTEKAEWYSNGYRDVTSKDRGKMCLGMYAFSWGFKVEATPTWYGMLLPDNTLLGVCEALQANWGATKPRNRAPVIGQMEVSTEQPDIGEQVVAAVNASDPDSDKLRWVWNLVQEQGDYGVTGTGAAMPKGFPDSIVEGQGTAKVKVVLPGGGKYRLYAYCFDDKGAAAYANRPLLGKGKAPELKLDPVDMPCPVYVEGQPERWYASGHMGNTGALTVDMDCLEKPYSGSKCIKVKYTATDNWVGVMWQSPANDWGNAPGGYNLSKADVLTFYAKGKYGGEKVTFAVGGLRDAKYNDTDKAEIKDVILTDEWKKYVIPLEDRNLRQIKTGFSFVFGGQGHTVTFYLDDIRYESDN